jgi:long-subunit fatty acid transport protein
MTIGRGLWATIVLLILLVVALIAAMAATAPARADAFNPLYRGIRETMMGGAFTAVADDEEAVYLNPAGMAGVKSAQFYLVDSMTEMSGDIITNFEKSRQTFSSFNTNTINELIGQNIYAREQFTPTFVMPNFGVSLMVDGQASLNTQNAAFPQIELGYQTTNGIQAAYGLTVYKRGKGDNTNELRIGVGGSFLFRRGGYNDISVVQALDEGSNILGDQSGSWQHGIGVDLGTQYIRKIRNLSLMAGSAYTQVGNINFGGQAAPQVGDLSVGVAAKYDLKAGTSVLVAYDYRYLNVDADYRKKQHLGMEFSLPIVKLYAGLNETYFTYGAAIDLWLIRIMACTYAEELGDIVGQEEDRRYMLGIQVKLGL